jgi:hypothetical protein
MVLVPNPNGGSMEVSSTADALAKGWTPAMGTFGVSPDGGTGGGGGGAVGQSTGGGAYDPGLPGTPAQQQAVINAAQQSAGTTRKPWPSQRGNSMPHWRSSN